MAQREKLFIDRIATPLGRAILIADDQGALRVHVWEDADGTWHKPLQRPLHIPAIWF